MLVEMSVPLFGIHPYRTVLVVRLFSTRLRDFNIDYTDIETDQ